MKSYFEFWCKTKPGQIRAFHKDLYPAGPDLETGRENLNSREE